MKHTEVAEESDSPDAGQNRVYLHPGQLYASAEPCSIMTILGTCVAVCLWDPKTRVGGVNHYLLPYFTGKAEHSGRFGVYAIDELLSRVEALGGVRKRLSAKVFGGIKSGTTFRALQTDLGQSNSDLAFKVLAEKRIPVLAQDVGGPRARKLIFNLHDGSAWVRPV